MLIACARNVYLVLMISSLICTCLVDNAEFTNVPNVPRQQAEKNLSVGLNTEHVHVDITVPVLITTSLRLSNLPEPSKTWATPITVMLRLLHEQVL